MAPGRKVSGCIRPLSTSNSADFRGPCSSSGSGSVRGSVMGEFTVASPTLGFTLNRLRTTDKLSWINSMSSFMASRSALRLATRVDAERADSLFNPSFWEMDSADGRLRVEPGACHMGSSASSSCPKSSLVFTISCTSASSTSSSSSIAASFLSVSSTIFSNKTATTTLISTMAFTTMKDTKKKATPKASATLLQCRRGRAIASDQDSQVRTWNMVYRDFPKLPKYSKPYSCFRLVINSTSLPLMFVNLNPLPKSLNRSTAMMA
mmetsp:Transcript_45463/g.98979  ORF Transcript_45463/g.98979 Transcript_45463/m.98979 type:complete len:264 (-) Transcript_45463:698-1489(-)